MSKPEVMIHQDYYVTHAGKKEEGYFQQNFEANEWCRLTLTEQV